jgi:hypothetical protein
MSKGKRTMGPDQEQEFVKPTRGRNESDNESFEAAQKAAAAHRKQREEVDKLLSEDSEAWLRGMKQYPGE